MHIVLVLSVREDWKNMFRSRNTSKAPHVGAITDSKLMQRRAKSKERLDTVNVELVHSKNSPDAATSPPRYMYSVSPV